MKLWIKFSLLLSIPILMAACVGIKRVLRDPCLEPTLVKDLSQYSPAELTRLARILEASAFQHEKSNGCRAALLAQIYVAKGQLSKASDYFLVASRKLPDMSDYFLLAQANVELNRKNLSVATNIAGALLTSSTALASQSFSLRVRKVLADIAVMKKEDQQIIKTHQDLLQRGYGENEWLLSNLAASLTNLGKHQEANEIYKKLLVNFPHASETIPSLRNLAHYNLDLKQVEARFDKLIKKLAFDQVITESNQLLKAWSLSDESHDHIVGLGIKSLLINNQFQTGLNYGYQRLNQTKPTAKAFENYAAGLAKVGWSIEAARYYEKFLTAANDKEEQAKACFFKGFSFYEAGLYSSAIKAWNGCQKAIQDSKLYENYLWYQALTSMLLNHFHKAQELLTDLIETFYNSNDREKYRYFLGYSLLNLNRESVGRTVLLDNLKKSPPSYYTLLTKKALGHANLRGVKIAPDALLSLAHQSKNQQCQNAAILFHVGFKEDARELVLRAPAPSAEKLGLLQHMGFYHDVWKRAHLVNPAMVVENGRLLPKVGLRAGFSMPHLALITDASKKYQLNSNLLYAVMQIESGFFEHAESSRGALGLMQMMPFIAEELALHGAVKRFSPEHLRDPKVSIELGALLLAILERQFNEPHLVAAAYNAGAHHVQKWRDRFGHLPVELFIERIPFKQTRDYVKKILFTESLYHALDGQDLRLAIDTNFLGRRRFRP